MRVTTFTDLRNTAGTAVTVTFERLVALLQDPPAAWQHEDKAGLPLLKLGTYDSDSRGAGHDLVEVSGLEGDYDSGLVDPADAAALLAAAGIRACVVTTPRHSLMLPRWRVWAPLAAPARPEARHGLLMALNGALGGVLAPESFVPKQCFYVGRLHSATAYQCIDVPGAPIDVHPSLAALMAAGVQPVDRATGAADRGSAGAHSEEQATLRRGVLAANRENWRENRPVLLSALKAIDPSCTYRIWMAVTAAFYYASGGHDEALAEWLSWSSGGSTYPGNDAAVVKWLEFGAMTEYSAGTLYHHAQLTGWTIGSVYTDTSVKAGENCTPVVDLAHCMANWVWLEKDDCVVLRERDGLILKWRSVRLSYAASFIIPPDTGKTKKAPSAPVLVADIWTGAKGRMSATAATYAPGQPPFCAGPTGVGKHLNLWVPTIRLAPKKPDYVEQFLEHVAFLVPDKAQRTWFLQWLAHIEQCPGELPHHHWLFVTRTQGIGRNMLALILGKVWAGHAAPACDLPALVAGGFNEGLANAHLAVVDEVQVGGATATFRNKLKALMTAETRDINVKYGLKYTQRNCCRWLMFSNSFNALPLEESDRRVNVVENPREPRHADYYVALHRAAHDPDFIESVAWYLSKLDITSFNPGARAAESGAKSLVIAHDRSTITDAVDAFVDYWPGDLAPVKLMQEFIAREACVDIKTLSRPGSYVEGTRAVLLSHRLKLSGSPMTVVVTRNHEAVQRAHSTDQAVMLKQALEKHAIILWGASQGDDPVIQS